MGKLRVEVSDHSPSADARIDLPTGTIMELGTTTTGTETAGVAVGLAADGVAGGA
jgi:hypothetical protein